MCSDLISALFKPPLQTTQWELKEEIYYSVYAIKAWELLYSVDEGNQILLIGLFLRSFAVVEDGGGEEEVAAADTKFIDKLTVVFFILLSRCR